MTVKLYITKLRSFGASVDNYNQLVPLELLHMFLEDTLTAVHGFGAPCRVQSPLDDIAPAPLSLTGVASSVGYLL